MTEECDHRARVAQARTRELANVLLAPELSQEVVAYVVQTTLDEVPALIEGNWPPPVGPISGEQVAETLRQHNICEPENVGEILAFMNSPLFRRSLKKQYVNQPDSIDSFSAHLISLSGTLPTTRLAIAALLGSRFNDEGERLRLKEVAALLEQLDTVVSKLRFLMSKSPPKEARRRSASEASAAAVGVAAKLREHAQRGKNPISKLRASKVAADLVKLVLPAEESEGWLKPPKPAGVRQEEYRKSKGG